MNTFKVGFGRLLPSWILRNNAIICIKQNGGQISNFAEGRLVCSNDVTILSFTKIQISAANTNKAF